MALAGSAVPGVRTGWEALPVRVVRMADLAGAVGARAAAGPADRVVLEGDGVAPLADRAVVSGAGEAAQGEAGVGVADRALRRMDAVSSGTGSDADAANSGG